ncbi:gonadotropin releasing hormone receptor 4 [Conger conger]|uniref:gonadotropin releasing hormone receptor 4 n=1 Tax=Conger conger TaxID=82655 RepID=UPI002A5A07B3|nr:gonadotropin releasing hormone receptor 4 [Conger conger]
MVFRAYTVEMNTSSHGPEFTTFRQTVSGAPPNGSWEAVAFTPGNGSAAAGEELPTFSTAAKVRVVITLVLCVVSAVCNLAVLWAASTSHKRRSHVRILIINLTLADLLVTFVVMPLDAVWNVTVQWLAGDLACRLLMFLKLLAMYSGAFVTVVISLDRQSAILDPLAINEAKKKNKVMLAVAWAMSAFLSVPQMFLFHNVTVTVPDNFTQCSTHGSFTEHWQETVYNMFTFVCLFLLPLAIMISCYTRILIEISKRMTKGNASSKEVHLRRSKNNIPKARMRALKMSIVIVVSFIVCWTPYYLLGLWYWFFPDDLEETVSHSLTHMLFIFGLFNACLDPITYGLFTIHLRKRVKRYCHSAAVLVESDNTDVTGSFRCSSSPLRLRREEGGVEEETERKSGCYGSYLTVRCNGREEPSQSSPNSMI